MRNSPMNENTARQYALEHSGLLRLGQHSGLGSGLGYARLQQRCLPRAGQLGGLLHARLGQCVLLALLLLGGTAMAAEGEPIDTSAAAMLSSPSVRLATPLTPATRTTQTQPEQSSDSERWLRLQASGGAASQHTQSATAAEQELANQRFLDSYQYPIPESFAEDNAGGGGGGN